MRNIVAKRLRKEAALLSKASGSYSILNVIYQGTKRLIKKDLPPTIINTETIKYSGYRRIYQDLKKAYVRG